MEERQSETMKTFLSAALKHEVDTYMVIALGRDGTFTRTADGDHIKLYGALDYVRRELFLKMHRLAEFKRNSTEEKAPPPTTTKRVSRKKSK